jgi:predicted regulator of Ras-like GTPase activity (Roadblock/LC7/MglB family)
MTIPFLSYFKRGKEKVAVAKEAPAKPVVAPYEKPTSERFSKTVMPNATRTISPQDPFQMASRSSAMGGQPAVGTTVMPRTISFVDSPAPRTRAGLPPAVALALEPKVERVISLELADIAAGISADYLKPLGEDANRRILLKASEVEKGMANGKPTVSLATIYQQVPQIFLRAVAPSDTSQVPLPFTKVLDQFTSLHVRGDQERHLAVPQVDTPFLKAAVEDSSRFGTMMEPLEMHPGDLPSVRIEPPTAEAFAAAEPEATAIPPATGSNGNGQGHKTAAQKSTTAPARIPFKLSPNGTDAPAPESVPASSGPSVPNLLPSPPAPVRIPFKMSPPAEEVRPKPEPWLTAETVAAAAETAPAPVSEPTAAPRSSEVKIALPLKPILQTLAPIQLSGDPASVPDDARIELPFALIEPQLAVGRISVTAKVFEVSMPAEYRAMFKSGEGAVDVSLPLQEVLKNLPTASLRMRDDQVEQEAGSNFATPFSAKAEEDAKRFNVPATPVAKPVLAEPASATDTADVSVEMPASDRPFRTPLQVALDTDEKLDAKGIVAQINKIAGVKSCAILFGDGLSLAGTLPAELETDALCAMAPSLMQRIENHLVDTKLGAIKGMTLSCTKGAVTFFMHENLCLAALHANVDLPTETREKLGRVVHELSRKYSHPV